MNMKIAEFIKSVKDLKKSQSALRKNYSVLKKMFICLASRSLFPCVDWSTFLQFCDDCDIIGEDISVNEIHEFFI